jgi:hypothetical protein
MENFRRAIGEGRRHILRRRHLDAHNALLHFEVFYAAPKACSCVSLAARWCVPTRCQSNSRSTEAGSCVILKHSFNCDTGSQRLAVALACAAAMFVVAQGCASRRTRRCMRIDTHAHS